MQCETAELKIDRTAWPTTEDQRQKTDEWHYHNRAPGELMSALTEKANPQKAYNLLWMGIDVGSTTVKVVVVDGETDDILWQDYQRHETKQPEKALEMLKQIAADFPATP